MATRKEALVILNRIVKMTMTNLSVNHNSMRDKVEQMIQTVGKLECNFPDSEYCEREIAGIIADFVDVRDRLRRIADNAIRANAKIVRKMADEAGA